MKSQIRPLRRKSPRRFADVDVKAELGECSKVFGGQVFTGTRVGDEAVFEVAEAVVQQFPDQPAQAVRQAGKQPAKKGLQITAFGPRRGSPASPPVTTIHTFLGTSFCERASLLWYWSLGAPAGTENARTCRHLRTVSCCAPFPWGTSPRTLPHSECAFRIKLLHGLKSSRAVATSTVPRRDHHSRYQDFHGSAWAIGPWTLLLVAAPFALWVHWD